MHHRRFLSLACVVASALCTAPRAQSGLQAFELKLNHATVNPGAIVSWNGKIRGNERRVTTRSAKWGLYLSLDRTITRSDTLILSGTLTNISFFVTKRLSGILKVPVATRPGRVFVGLFIDHDNKVRENNESDNIAIAPLDVRATVDVEMSNATALTNPRRSGAGMHVLFRFANKGNLRAGSPEQPVRFGIFLGDTATASDSDMFLGESTAVIDGGRSSGRQVFVRIPSGIEGTYYLRVVADYDKRITEAKETNNTAQHQILVQPTTRTARAIEWVPSLTSVARTCDRAVVSTTIGGRGDLVVVAPELAGGEYVCFLSGSPTFALDLYSNVSLALMNGPVLPSWLGALNAKGVGAPAVAFPGLPRVDETTYVHAFARGSSEIPFAPCGKPVQLRFASPR